MPFCEQCGAKLSASVNFCEECGAMIETGFSKESIAVSCANKNASIESLFKNRDWKNDWRSAAQENLGCELGLIITRESALLDSISQETTPTVEYNKMINNYLKAAKSWGTYYHYLNLDDLSNFDGQGCANSVVAALREVINVACPKYLLILGDYSIIDCIRWENMTGDGDGLVESDLCYATLDTRSPWDGLEYDFSKTMRVGRIPSIRNCGLEPFIKYFTSAQNHIGTFNEISAFGLTALEWEDESKYEFAKISTQSINTSPESTLDEISDILPKNTNLMYFNLHGSEETAYWYGQDSNYYPETFDPFTLSSYDSPFFLGVEACYGAKFHGDNVYNSILLSALQNNCLSFLGSSKIAFGASAPEGSCADIVVGNYLKYLSKGYSAGDAHAEGLKSLTSNYELVEDTEIKTLAEFCLYGDPSAIMFPINRSSSKPKGKSHNIVKGIHIPMPNIRNAITAALTKVDEKIEKNIDAFVIDRFFSGKKKIDFKLVEQKTFKMGKSKLNQKIYKYKNENMKNVIKVYFDNQGEIKKTLVSK